MVYLRAGSEATVLLLSHMLSGLCGGRELEATSRAGACLGVFQLISVSSVQFASVERQSGRASAGFTVGWALMSD